MKHLTYGENWFSLEPSAFSLPRVYRGPSITSLALKDAPPLQHSWYVVRDFLGNTIFQGPGEQGAKEALTSYLDTLPENYPSEMTSHLLLRYGILEPHKFTVTVRPDGVGMIRAGVDETPRCLVFWSHEGEPVPSRSRIFSRICEGRQPGRKLISSAISIAWGVYRHSKDTGTLGRCERLLNFGITAAILSPGEAIAAGGPLGFQSLHWDGNQLYHQEVEIEGAGEFQRLGNA
jgi:hypothetical protein